VSKLYRTITEDLKALGLNFRINDLDESLEVKTDGRWERITDTLEKIIKTDLRGIGYGGRKKPSITTAADAWTKLAHNQRYNPIKNYLLSLEGKYEPGEPGRPYVNELFSKFFDNPDGWFSRWLFRWMVGAIAKVFDQQRNPMLVLVGGQHMGKSYFARWLCPIDKNRHFVEQAINTDSKDHKLRLADRLIWEVPELGATTRRADIEALKAFITTRDIYERPPYGRYPIHKPALCSFIGSVNDDGAGFLNDPTGSTRFLACELTDIDHSYTIQPVEQLWAEAYWFYRNTERAWELLEEEQTTRDVINASFEMVSALEDCVLARFVFTGNADDRLTNEQIKDHLAGAYTIRNENGFVRELNRIMKKHGAAKYRSTYVPGQPHLRGFYGIKRCYPGDEPNPPQPQPEQGEF